MTQVQFTAVGLYNGRPYRLFSVSYDTDVETAENVYRLIAQGFREQADDFEFAAMVEGYDDDGEDTPAG